MPKTIRQTVTFDATPQQVYNTLMDSRKHSACTGAGAIISPKVGGKISAYDGYIEGTNLELVPGKKIVQQWRGSDWPVGHFSIASFSLIPSKGKTKLVFRQTGVPGDQYKSIKQGWLDFYWKPMKEMFLQLNRR